MNLLIGIVTIILLILLLYLLGLPWYLMTIVKERKQNGLIIYWKKDVGKVISMGGFTILFICVGMIILILFTFIGQIITENLL
jgi:hypothetical protein